MNEFPTIYFGLNVFLFGVSIYAVLQSSFVFMIMREKDMLPPLLFSSAVSVYMAGNISVILLIHYIPHNSIARVFTMIHVLFPMSFMILGQYIVRQILPPNAAIQKANRAIMGIAAAVIMIITGLSMAYPDLLIKGSSVAGYTMSFRYSIQDMGPLFVIRDILMGSYLIFCIVNFFIYRLHRHDQHPGRYTLAGLILVGYFYSTYLYILFFASDRNTGAFSYNYLGTGLIILLVLMTFERIKIHAGNVNRLNEIKNDLDLIHYNDSLLSIPNRMAFVRDIREKLKNITTNDNACFLLFFDIDDFQDINDCYSEYIGNEVLKSLTGRLDDLFSQEGILYRIGGDEFAFSLKAVRSEDEAKDVAGKIISCMRNPFIISGIPYMITVSLGVLQIPRDGKNTDTILNNAYNVIRRAKKTKNTFKVFSQEIANDTGKKIYIVNSLRNSIEKNEFTIFYQPIVDRRKKIIHSEALLRYSGKDSSINGPGTFIPILENAGLMKEVDNMVIRKVYRDLTMKINGSLNISINLSTNQLVDPAYSDFLVSFADQLGIEKKRIIFEITENKLIENLLAGHDNIAKLKKNGFTIAVDDFGKGYSSLSYLSELPVDILKMDMVFVKPVPGDPKQEAMAKYIIDLAHSLGLKVVAEGLERQEQLDFLSWVGCDLFQGYYLGRPMPLNELLSKYF